MGTSVRQVLARWEAVGCDWGDTWMGFPVTFYQAFLAWFLKSGSEQLQHRVLCRIEVSSVGRKTNHGRAYFGKTRITFAKNGLMCEVFRQDSLCTISKRLL